MIEWTFFQYAFKFTPFNGSKCIEKKVQKGLKKSSIKNHLSYKDYEDALELHQNISKPSFSIRSFDHELFTIFQRKQIVNSFDDKRWLLSCNYHTKAYGSSYIKKHKDKCLECEK